MAASKNRKTVKTDASNTNGKAKTSATKAAASKPTFMNIDSSGASAVAARQAALQRLLDAKVAADEALKAFQVETEDAVRTAACEAIDAWLAEKSLDDADDSRDSDESSAATYDALQVAIIAIRRTAWAGSNRHLDRVELARLTPECSFLHKKLNRFFVVTTGEHLGDILQKGSQTHECELIVSVPVPSL